MKKALQPKFLIAYGVIAVIVIAGVGFFAERAITNSAEGRVYRDVNAIPYNDVGLLLGTAKYASNGRLNLFYTYRLDAAERLFNQGKIQFILVSGDNGTVEYNEPEEMQRDLIARGIPEEQIYLDYAGFRTWDSVIRAKEVFGQQQFTIISQEFHNQRALYAAKANTIDAIAFNAQDVPVERSPAVWLRERVARVVAVFDATVNRKPRFLGEPISIE